MEKIAEKICIDGYIIEKKNIYRAFRKYFFSFTKRKTLIRIFYFNSTLFFGVFPFPFFLKFLKFKVFSLSGTSVTAVVNEGGRQFSDFSKNEVVGY